MRSVLITPHAAPHPRGQRVPATGGTAFGTGPHGAHGLHPIRHHRYPGGACFDGGPVHRYDPPGRAGDGGGADA